MPVINIKSEKKLLNAILCENASYAGDFAFAKVN
jgi:hypothetical protein